MTDEFDRSVERIEALYERVKAARARLEAAGDDGETAIDVIAELSELTREVETEIARAKREAEPDADA